MTERLGIVKELSGVSLERDFVKSELQQWGDGWSAAIRPQPDFGEDEYELVIWPPGQDCVNLSLRFWDEVMMPSIVSLIQDHAALRLLVEGPGPPTRFPESLPPSALYG